MTYSWFLKQLLTQISSTEYNTLCDTICLAVLFQEVIDRYMGVVKMLDGGDRIKLDQEHLETVIPALGMLTCDFLFY